MAGWSRLSLSGVPWRVLRSGSGSPVIVRHEVFGMTPEVLAFAESLTGQHTVYLPVFSGPDRVVGRVNRSLAAARLCVASEFVKLATGRTSPAVEGLKTLARHTASTEYPQVGLVGLCLTGSLELALAGSDPVSEAVVAVPTLPFPSGARRRDLGIGPVETAEVVRRTTSGEVRVLALRFRNDCLCPAVRFDTLREVLRTGGPDVLELDSRPGNRFGFPRSAHSTLAYARSRGLEGRQELDRITDVVRMSLAGRAVFGADTP
jgi:dienelactone hydrolase